MLQEGLMHLVSFQGNEIRKMVNNAITELVKIKDLDPKQLSLTIEKLKVMIDNSGNSIKELTDIATANNNAVKRTKQEILDTIASLDKDNNINITNKLNELKLSLEEKMNIDNKSLELKIGDVKKELLLEQKLNVFELCNSFTRSLYNYSDYICIMDKQISTGNNTLRIKLSGDHFYSKSAAYDNNLGSPKVKVTIDEEVVYEADVQAVKIYNQYEYININTNKDIKDVKIEFVTDAWEGGTDANKDGLSEDRNLYVFEVMLNNKQLDTKVMTYVVGTEIKPFQEVMPWKGYIHVVI